MSLTNSRQLLTILGLKYTILRFISITETCSEISTFLKARIDRLLLSPSEYLLLGISKITVIQLSQLLQPLLIILQLVTFLQFLNKYLHGLLLAIQIPDKILGMLLLNIVPQLGLKRLSKHARQV